ncbi:hypothetical protein OH77DRAFT_1427152 [Trametes cingulata]|nr:hypothetical protein OH77DRAFT_1427152 [Trametes cingulata]
MRSPTTRQIGHLLCAAPAHGIVSITPIAFSNAPSASLGLVYLLPPLCSVCSVSCIPPPSGLSERLSIACLTISRLRPAYGLAPWSSGADTGALVLPLTFAAAHV